MFRRYGVTALALCLAAGVKTGRGQSADIAPAKLPAWDVISVKQSDAHKCQGMGMGKTPDGIDMSCVPLVSLIQQPIVSRRRTASWERRSGRETQAYMASMRRWPGWMPLLLAV